MKRFSFVALLVAALGGLGFAWTTAGASAPAGDTCGCIDCRCPNCDGETCSCDVCECGACACAR